MAVSRSPEIEAVARRILAAWPMADSETMSNLFSSDSSLRVIGFDVDEWYRGPDEFLEIFVTQTQEMPDWNIEVHEIEAFEEGSFGYATVRSTIVTAETKAPMRDTGVFRLEGGAWRVIHWHNSIGVPNQQVFGVELTTTLDHLVSSVLDDTSDLGGARQSEGTMTLVFTDIVDSTNLAQSSGDGVWVDLVGAHEAAIRRITAREGGTVVKFLGDGSMLAFDSARAAVRAAVQIQEATAVQPFDVRVGIHSGEVIRTSNDLFGVTVNKAARVAMTAERGGIMVSSTTRDLVGSMEGVQFEDPRIVTLKGLTDKHQVFPVESGRLIG